MHLHIIGICGTYMGSLAQLAVARGHRVTGCDANVYPPMSDQLSAAGIEVIEGFGVDQLALNPDQWVVGNVARRGLALVEALLDRGDRLVSGPQWMAEALLPDYRVLAVSGTHGKTTTSSLIAWILEDAGLSPGFLIGGVPENFGVSARLGPAGAPFVVEADEYDTAFFDKRSKFIHLRAQVAVLNNLEFDHADIFPNLEAIETQFHHWIRTLSSKARLVVNARQPALERVLRRGSWSEVQAFAGPPWAQGVQGGWMLGELGPCPGFGERFEILHPDGRRLAVESPLLGQHNRENALAAICAVEAFGVQAHQAVAALARFRGVKRRMQLRGEVRGVKVYDDFAHHPTAIRTTMDGLRRTLGPGQRLIAVFEPRSNTMKLGTMRAQLPEALAEADLVMGFAGGLDWPLEEALKPLGARAVVFQSLDALKAAAVSCARPGDHFLLMSNGSFGGLHTQLLEELARG
jgi:UDP-N-acetylmuramate: L-alanyl-gamma-D-glutamyl-meso-diaminopimelate ligase